MHRHDQFRRIFSVSTGATDGDAGDSASPSGDEGDDGDIAVCSGLDLALDTWAGEDMMADAEEIISDACGSDPDFGDWWCDRSIAEGDGEDDGAGNLGLIDRG